MERGTLTGDEVRGVWASGISTAQLARAAAVLAWVTLTRSARWSRDGV